MTGKKNELPPLGVFGALRLALTETWLGTAPSEWISDNLVLLNTACYPLVGVMGLIAVGILWPLHQFAGIDGRTLEFCALLPAGWFGRLPFSLLVAWLYFRHLKRHGQIKDGQVLRDHRRLWFIIRVSPYVSLAIGAAIIVGAFAIAGHPLALVHDGFLAPVVVLSVI